MRTFWIAGVSVIIATISGCGGSPDPDPTPIEVTVPPAYRSEPIIYGTNIYDGAVLIAVQSIPESTYRLLNGQFRQTYAIPKTPSGDINVSEKSVTFGTNHGFKYAILDRASRKSLEIKYVFQVSSAFAYAEITAGGPSFDETKYEPIFATIRLKPR